MQITKFKSSCCPECGAATLTAKARLRLGNIKCTNCGGEFRLARSPGLKIFLAILGQGLFVWFLYLGITTWNWWPMLVLMIFAVISPLLTLIFGQVEIRKK